MRAKYNNSVTDSSTVYRMNNIVCINQLFTKLGKTSPHREFWYWLQTLTTDLSVSPQTPHSPIETSLMSSAAACAPCTRARVHEDRSQWVSTRKTWDSIPRPVPVRVANTRSDPWEGDPFALPEWTSLERKTHTKKVAHLTFSKSSHIV